MATYIKSFNEEELFQHLSLTLDKDIAKVMKDQKVSGEDFLDLTDEDLKEFFPLLGDRKKVLRLKSSCLTVGIDERMAAAPTATPREKPKKLVCNDLTKYPQCMCMICACSISCYAL